VSLLRTSAKSSRNIDHHGSVNTTLSGRQLTLSRIVWAVLVVLILVIFFAGIPLFYAQYQTVCESLVCNISPQQAQTLRQFGISIKGLALANLAFALLWACTWFAIGAVLAWHKSNDWMGLLVSGMLILQGTTGVTVVTRASSSIWQLPSTLLNDLAFVVVSLVFFLFPDGRFVPRWTRWIVVLLVIVGGLDVLFPDVGVFYSLLTLGSIVCLVVAQLYRYWRISNQTQRQQTRWVVYSISVMVVFNILLASPLLLPAFSPPGSVYFLFAQPLLMLTALLFPISIGIAILRYQLWDIDIIIHRTLVYSLLTFLVVGIYVLIVGGLGTVLQVQGNLVLSLLATGLIAVLFQPLRIFLQRRINRLLYGQRDEPYAVISRLGSRLEATLAPAAVLPTIVETVAQALKLPYVAILLNYDGELSTVAEYGKPARTPLSLPLLNQGETIGQLVLAPRSPREALSAADTRLLNELARQIGLAAHAVRLTDDLQRSNEHLAAARVRLVTAREEERRRLRRDLHDGLGPTLAALTLKIGAARKLLIRDLDAADTLLLELNGDIETTTNDIRRLVSNLRPASLDELGLVGAIRERVAQSTFIEDADHVKRLRILVEAPESLPQLPAAVEVAAYRIVQEALTNVVRHAHAYTCHIHLSLDEMLSLEVCDDGLGFAAEHHAGVGIRSMHERATELGGTCVVEIIPTGGMRILARLPVLKEE
jgi:signal transduction histidine kinase